jgi:hypothetical protein
VEKLNFTQKISPRTTLEVTESKTKNKNLLYEQTRPESRLQTQTAQRPISLCCPKAGLSVKKPDTSGTCENIFKVSQTWTAMTVQNILFFVINQMANNYKVGFTSFFFYLFIYPEATGL